MFFSGGWSTWSPLFMCGSGIKDSVVGIVGFGRIGTSVATKLLAFEPKEILYHNKIERPQGFFSAVLE